MPTWTALANPLAWVLLLSMILLSVWYAIRLLLLLLAGPDVVVTAAVQPASNTDSSYQRASGSQLAGWHLFGQAAELSPLNLSMLPETPLDLSLSGIVSGTQSDQDGHAIIIAGDGSQWVYGVGDSVVGEATVVAITPDQVVLERSGRRETLSLPMRDKNTMAAGTDVAGTAAQPGSYQAGGQLINAPINNLTGMRDTTGSVAAVGMGNISLAGAPLDTAKLTQLAQSVRVTPVRGGGFRVFPGRNATIFRDLGLHANDVITAVNGQPLNDAQAAMKLFQSLDSSAGITLSVKRGDQTLQLQPDVSGLER